MLLLHVSFSVIHGNKYLLLWSVQKVYEEGKTDVVNLNGQTINTDNYLVLSPPPTAPRQITAKAPEKFRSFDS